VGGGSVNVKDPGGTLETRLQGSGDRLASEIVNGNKNCRRVAMYHEAAVASRWIRFTRLSLGMWAGALVGVTLLAMQPGASERPVASPGLIERVARLESKRTQDERILHWLSGNLYRPGMILPYHGPLVDAVALEKEGWFVCDGRPITDPRVARRFRDQATPDLRGHLLKGSAESGSFVGHASVTTSDDGVHSHLLPNGWFHRGLRDGNRNGIDTKDDHPNNGNPRVQPDGLHHHTVAMDPPAYTVRFLLYVREVAANP
jgi:hypothetical protein